MKKLAVIAILLVVAAGLWLWLAGEPFAPGGPELHVLFDRGESVRAGDPVTLEGEPIGRVESVERQEDGKVRLTVRLGGGSVPSASTFKEDGRRLACHVLDPSSPPFKDGDSVEGVGSTLELMVKIGQSQASQVLRKVAESEWVKELGRAADGIRKEIASIDWEAMGQELADRWREIDREMGRAAELTEEEARREYRRLKPDVERLIRELERLGKSKQAERLRREFEELWEK